MKSVIKINHSYARSEKKKPSYIQKAVIVAQGQAQTHRLSQLFKKNWQMLTLAGI